MCLVGDVSRMRGAGWVALMLVLLPGHASAAVDPVADALFLLPPNSAIRNENCGLSVTSVAVAHVRGNCGDATASALLLCSSPSGGVRTCRIEYKATATASWWLNAGSFQLDLIGECQDTTVRTWDATGALTWITERLACEKHFQIPVGECYELHFGVRAAFTGRSSPRGGELEERALLCPG